jgi:hypothetical protein
MPDAHPIRASTRLSVSVCAARRPRLTPRARRRATSRRRRSARPRKRLATLAQAIRRTMRVTPVIERRLRFEAGSGPVSSGALRGRATLSASQERSARCQLRT